MNRTIARWTAADSGFTLVELLIAIVLLGLMAVSFLNIFNTGTVNIFAAGARDEGLDQALAILETLYQAADSGAGPRMSRSGIESFFANDLPAHIVSRYSFSYYLDDVGVTIDLIADDSAKTVTGTAVTIEVEYLAERRVSLTGFVAEEANADAAN